MLRLADRFKQTDLDQTNGSGKRSYLVLPQNKKYKEVLYLLSKVENIIIH